MSKIDEKKEIELIKLNKKLFKFNNNQAFFEIEDALDVLDTTIIPPDIKMNNNKIFIRDISNYIFDKNLKPNIPKYQ